MNFVLADKLSELLESQKLDEAIAMAERELKIFRQLTSIKFLTRTYCILLLTYQNT